MICMKKKIISLPTSAFTLHLRLYHRKDRRKKIELVKKGVDTNSLKSADENARKLSLRYDWRSMSTRVLKILKSVTYPVKRTQVEKGELS